MTLWKSVITELATPTDPMPADPGAASPSAVTESSTLAVVKLAMTETTSMVTDAQAPAKRSAATDVLTPVKFAMTDHAMMTLNPLAAEPTANCQAAVMVLPTHGKNAITPDKTLPDPTSADLTVLFLNVVTVLLTTCTVNFATKVAETH